MSGQNAAAQECFNIPRLLQQFESLGENCDLGVIQRAVGLEPFGLFRFAFCNAAGVAALLRARFQPLGEPEDLWLDEVGPRREYWVKSRQFSIEAHSDRYGGQDDRQATRAAQLEKMRFLRDHLIRDLARGRKLFVFKGKADMATIEDMAAQMQNYGPNCLLWVGLAGSAHQPGTGERVSPQLLRGFLSRFGTHDGSGPRPPVEEWIQVCAEAYRLSRGADPPKTPIDNLISRAAADGTCQWFGEAPLATRPIDEPTLTPGIMLEHRLGSAGPATVYGAHLPIASGGPFAFSVWVRIPQGFRGLHIEALLPGFASVAMWTADLKYRERWKRLWVTANLPEDARSITCEIVAQGVVGDVFQSALWCLERGYRALGNGFSL